MSKQEITAVYAASFIQGVGYVAFPAAATIFTNPHEFNFSSTMYGSLFIPQAILSIAFSLLSIKLCNRYGSKPVYFLGLIANLISMVLLALSTVAMHNTSWAFGILLTATAFLGLGLGLTAPTLNTIAALLYPEKINSIILIVNALLGVGTVLAPIFMAIFVGFGFWWGFPVLMTILIFLLLLYSIPLQFPGGKTAVSQASQKISIPPRFWLFVVFAVLYGIIETLNGNWALIYMKKHVHASIKVQSLALATFWGMLTVGRVLFAAIEKQFAEWRAFRILPFIAAVAFILLASLPPNNVYLAIFAFGLAGFGCSALYPLTISFGDKQLTSFTASIAGGVLASDLFGYGIAAFGAGPLLDRSIMSLKEIYAVGAFIALILGGLAYIITQKSAVKQEERR